MRDLREVRIIDRLRLALENEEYERTCARAARIMTVTSLSRWAQVHLRCIEAEGWIRLGDLSIAAARVSELQRFATEADASANIRLVEALLWTQCGDAKRAIPAAIRALRSVTPNGYGSREGICARSVLGVALLRLGHYHWARRAFEYCAAHHRLLGRKVALAETLVNLALVAKNRGHSDAALDIIDDAISILPESGHPRARTAALITRGICLVRRGHMETALRSFVQAHSLLDHQTDRHYRAAVSTNLGHLYRMRGAFDLAREFYADALTRARASGSARRECLGLEFLAETAIEQHEFDEALEMLAGALALAEKLSGGADLAMEILRRRGEALLALGRPDEARVDLERGLRMCRARGERREGLLTDRAYALAFASAEEKPQRVQEILQGLRDIDDRFEFVRTVCFAIENELKPEEHTWLHDAFVSASHYIATSGLDHWRKRLEQAAGYQKSLTLKAADSEDAQLPSIPSRSERFQRALESARIAARSSDPALILGETGSGKEVISRLIHTWSRRAPHPLIAVNCGAIPENLIEGELFGHVRGAFTGAERDRVGLFEAADGGSVLLDEIGDLPMQMQVKLLRFLDNYEVRRVGDPTVRRVDVRIIAATNRDLQQLVASGAFRDDLFFRLKVFRVDIPPLRERRDDIPDLVRQFMRECSHSRTPLTVSDALMNWFQDGPWPGNVRELRAVCSFLTARVYGRPQAGLADLPPEYAPTNGPTAEVLDATTRFDLERREFQRRQYERALRESQGNIQVAARILRMGRNHLAQRMREHGLRREDFRADGDTAAGAPRQAARPAGAQR